MLRIVDQPGYLCDGPTRREILAVGGLLPLGLGLDQLLAVHAAPGKGRPTRKAKARSCLLIFMEGGPSHIDLWDMKPEAPAEVRGVFAPIKTTLHGVPVCEHLPLLAGQMHRLALVRSVTHSITDHNAGSYYALTGHYPTEGSKLIVADARTNFPPFGAVLAQFRPAKDAMPPFVHIPEVMSNNGFKIPGQSAGFLGAAYDPLLAGDPSLSGYEVPGLAQSPEVSLERLGKRGELLGNLDRVLGSVGDSPALARMGEFQRKAVELAASDDVRRAFDLSQEPQRLRERYGIDPGSNRDIEARKFGGLPHLGQCLLLARRLIEAGVRLVTVCTGRSIDQAWDTHRDHFPLLKRSLLPPFDRAFSALLEDMAARGLLEETLVVAMGEFGRTPKLGLVTSGAGAARDGRDHWPYCYTVLFAGGGVPAGLVHGASDRQGAHPSRDPVKPEDLAATIYELLGVPSDTEVHDLQNRPYPLTQGRPIQSLFGRS